MASADRGRPAFAQSFGDGTPAAALLGAGFALRALAQLAAVEQPGARQSLDGLAVLLYCIGFGVALQCVSTARYPIRLATGTAGLLAGVLLAGLLGQAQIGLALAVSGAALFSLTMLQSAGHAEAGFARLAMLVSAAGPVLIAMHAMAFPNGGNILSARFLRLAAAAAMALPLLAALYRTCQANEATRASRLARALLGIGMVAMPLVLVLSALVDERAKYALGPASDCFTVALIIACVQAWRGRRVASLAGFGGVLASMLLGKAMGFYAFEGPLAAPAPLAGYADAWRVALRNFHIDLIVLGYTFLLWPSLVRLRTIAAAGLALTAGLLAPVLGSWSPLVGVVILSWVVAFWRGRAAA